MLWLCPTDRALIFNPITKHSLSIWDRFRFTHNLQSPHNPLLSVLRNPGFYPAWEFPGAFTAWSAANLFRLHKLVSANVIHTFPTLCKSYGFSRSELFCYLQIKNFYMPLLRTGSLLTQMSQFKSICKSEPHIRGLILILYQQLNVNPDNSPPSYVNKWAQDLERTFEIADWSSIWMATKSSSPNVLAIETNYKVLARWYLVLAIIAKYVPSYLGTCFQGCSAQNTHIQVWWHCPVAQQF